MSLIIISIVNFVGSCGYSNLRLNRKMAYMVGVYKSPTKFGTGTADFDFSEGDVIPI